MPRRGSWQNAWYSPATCPRSVGALLDALQHGTVHRKLGVTAHHLDEIGMQLGGQPAGARGYADDGDRADRTKGDRGQLVFMGQLVRSHQREPVAAGQEM